MKNKRLEQRKEGEVWGEAAWKQIERGVTDMLSAAGVAQICSERAASFIFCHHAGT